MKHEARSPSLSRSFRKEWFSLASVLFSAGCAPTIAPGLEAPGASLSAMRTDRAAYVLAPTGPMQRPGLAIIVTYQNASAERRFLDTCDKRPPRWHLEKQVGEAWVPAYEPACTLVAPEHPPAIAPGAIRTDTLVVVDHGPNLPRFTGGAIPGTYRVVYLASAEGERGMSQQLPLDQRISNEFEIREPRP
jgi:hypothetical protein